MPYCGEKYAFRIRNTIGGTIEQPCNIYCNMPDWESWRAAMESLQGEVVRKAADLRKKAQGQGRIDVFDEVAGGYVGPAQNAVAAAQSAEPTGMGTVPGSTEIVNAVGKCIEAMNLLACALEQVDGGYSKLNLPVPATPGAVGGDVEKRKPVDWELWAKRAGIAAGVGLLGYAAVKYFAMKRMGGGYPSYGPYRPGGFR